MSVEFRDPFDPGVLCDEIRELQDRLRSALGRLERIKHEAKEGLISLD